MDAPSEELRVPHLSDDKMITLFIPIPIMSKIVANVSHTCLVCVRKLCRRYDANRVIFYQRKKLPGACLWGKKAKVHKHTLGAYNTVVTHTYTERQIILPPQPYTRLREGEYKLPYFPHISVLAIS